MAVQKQARLTDRHQRGQLIPTRAAISALGNLGVIRERSLSVLRDDLVRLG